MMIQQLEKIANSSRTKTPQRLRAMKILTKRTQTSYMIVRDVDMDGLEQEIEAAEEDVENAFLSI